MHINFKSSAELAASIRKGETTSEEVVSAYLDQIAAHNPVFNAIATQDREAALQRAREADAALAQGQNWGPLHGVPITIKDTYRVKGLRTTSGHPSLKNYIPEEDAVVVRLLKDAGAVILGKTNTTTLAMDMQTVNPLFGRTNNPWDIERTPAGSSGGCAAALASGMTALSIGSDLAGSIRLPASFCGVYGLKPTHGVISMEGHIPPLPGQINGFRTLAVPGPLARSVDDLALALRILTQPNPYDRKVAPLLPAPTTGLDIANLRIAWTDSFGDVPVSREIKAHIADFVEKLARAGATVEKAVPPNMDYTEVWELWSSFVGMQSSYEMSNFMRTIGDVFTRKTVRDIPMQRNIVGPISVPKLMQALELQSHYITKMDNFLTEYDVWICPVSSTTAFKHHEHTRTFGDFRIYDTPVQVDESAVPYYVATQSYTTVLTTTDSPVVSMPVGLSETGLPINVQVVGKRYSDYRLLEIVRVLDQYKSAFDYPLLVQ